MSTVSDWIDKAKDMAYSTSRALGEELGIKTSSEKIMNEAKRAMSFNDAHLREVLPYESIDKTSNVFHNRQTYGFGFHVLPLAGADERLVDSLAQLLKNKLPAGWDCQAMLYKNSFVGGQIDKSYEPLLQKGGLYAELAKMSIKYHKNAAKSGYKNKSDTPSRLSDYRCFLFISTLKSKTTIKALDDVSADIEAELSVCGFSYVRIGLEDFSILIRSFLSPKTDSVDWPEVYQDFERPLSDSLPEHGTSIAIGDSSIDIEVGENNLMHRKTKIISLIPTKWPEYFSAWQSPDNYANIFRTEIGIKCPFVISFHIRGLDDEKEKRLAARKYKSLRSRLNPIYMRLNPGIEYEAQEYEYVHKELSQDNLSLVDCSFNILLFSTPETYKRDLAEAIGAFRYNGFELKVAFGTQWLRYLSLMPFVMSEGMFSILDQFSHIKKMTHRNAANLLPLICDFKGSSTGLLLPTTRNQIAFFDSFDSNSLPIVNFNMTIKGSSGSGKSMFTQALVVNAIANNQQVFIIDIGESYKHLAEMCGGSYISLENIKINPFTLFDFDGTSLSEKEDGSLMNIDSCEQIRDLLCLMASPDEQVEQIQKDWLLSASRKAWDLNGKNACIDDVVANLEEMVNKTRNDFRLTDLITHLEKYTKKGIYGDIFNSKTPLLKGNKLVVLELGGLSNKPNLLKIVMFSLIVVIQGQFYQGDRAQKKLCIIDEAWQFLATGDNPLAANFISTGFRTARKHNGGFAVITQNLDDLESTIQGRAIDASSDMSVVMRQGSFKEYVKKNPNAYSEREQRLIESFGEAKGNGFSEMMLRFGRFSSFHRLFCDPFSKILFSSSADEFEAVEDLRKKGKSIEEAVTEVALKFYGEEVDVL